MAGFVVDFALILAGVIASQQEEKNTNRKDRAYDLGHSLQDISERVKSTYETAEGLLPKDDSDREIWKTAISENGVRVISEALNHFRDFGFPMASQLNISELFHRRFLMRKLELQLQGTLVSIKNALPAVSKLKAALSTYTDLAKSGTIPEAQAEEAKKKALADCHGVDIQLPSLPSNQVIFDELHQRDVTTKVYMDEDPTLQDTERWLTTI